MSLPNLPHELSARTAVDLPQRLTDWLVTHGVRVVAIVLVALVLRLVLVRTVARLVRRAVDSGLHSRLRRGKATRVLAQATGAMHERRRQRTETLGSVLRSVITGFVYGVALLMVLSEFGVNLAPLIASAGVVGVALGFGAQSLVKDFLSGIFMLLEDQYGVGDVVDVGEAVGTVEEVSLRITRIRDANGVAWYVRNGEIVRVANRSQGWSTALIDFPVAFNQDLEKVQRVIADVLHEVWEDERWKDVLLEEPTVAGVEQITGTTVTLRVVAKTAANQQFAVQRDIRERVLVAFDQQHVRPPAVYPGTPGAPGTGSIAGTV
ncbi:mechanosensitive ion channel family protein [Angustibacter aerolatus]